MAELEEEIMFDVVADGAIFTTRTNGDKLVFDRLRLTQEQSTSLAWLVNSKNHIQVQIKVKP